MNINATILGQSIAFIIFVWFCMKYIWPPLMSAIEKRQKEIADSLASAERAKKEINIAQMHASNQLQEARIEAQLIIEQANQHKSKILNETKAKAKEERIKIISQAKIEIETERQRVYEELRKQVGIIAISLAEKIIENSVDKTVSKDIINKFIAKL